MPSSSKPACLVTGHAGFVGSHLTEALLHLGYPVVGVDLRSEKESHNLCHLLEHPNFFHLQRNIDDKGVLSEVLGILPSIKHVFHLAAVVSVAYSMTHPEETLHTNYTATVNLHNEAVSMGMDSFTFAGSAAEYGADDRLPLREEYATDTTQQESPYGEAKYRASAHIIASGFGCSLRAFNIFGPHQDPSSPYSGVISQFILRATKGEKLTIFGDGNQTRDFIFVGDMVRAYLLASGLMHTNSTPCQGAFNIGTGRTVTINELAETVVHATGDASTIFHAAARSGDIYHSKGNIDAFATATGFAAEVSLREGLERTLDWMQRQRRY